MYTGSVHVLADSHRYTWRVPNVSWMGIKGRLYTTGDIADLLGVGRQRAYTLSRQRDFPEPYDEWPGGLAVWRVEDIERWARNSDHYRDRMTGRD